MIISKLILLCIGLVGGAILSLFAFIPKIRHAAQKNEKMRLLIASCFVIASCILVFPVIAWSGTILTHLDCFEGRNLYCGTYIDFDDTYIDNGFGNTLVLRTMLPPPLRSQYCLTDHVKLCDTIHQYSENIDTQSQFFWLVLATFVAMIVCGLSVWRITPNNKKHKR
jgi:H+/Cl- antiporter ClcA